MKKTPTLKKLKQRITGKKNRTDLAKTSNTAKRLSSSPIFTLDYIEYQLSEWGLETPDPLCHFSLSVTHEHLVQPIPCSILTEPVLQRTFSPRWPLGPALGSTGCFFSGCTLVLKMNLPRMCSEVGVSSMEKVVALICLATPCGQTTFADGRCPQEHQLGKSKSILLSPGRSLPIPSNQPSPPNKEMRCWVLLVFPRWEMARLNAHLCCRQICLSFPEQ